MDASGERGRKLACFPGAMTRQERRSD